MTVRAFRKGNSNDFYDVIKPASTLQIDFGATSTVGERAIPADAEIAQFFATEDCWVVMGPDPEAAVNDGESFFVPGGIICHYGVQCNEYIAAIQTSSSGSLFVTYGESN